MKWRVAIFLGCIAALAMPARATIRYRISVAHPERHFSYRVQDVHAATLEADDVAQPLKVTKLTKDSWRIDSLAPSSQDGAHTGRGAVARLPGVPVLGYEIYWDEPGPFNSQINLHHAFVNFAEVLLYIPARRNE